jgi:transcription antitermination factor NusG
VSGATVVPAGRKAIRRFARPSLAVPGPIWGAALDPCGPVEPGPGRWFALRVAPQAEFACAHLLRARGLAAWAPWETKWIRANRYRKGAKREVRRPLLPGYVLARLGDWEAEACAWQRALGVVGVQGVVGALGRPLALREAAVADLRALCERRRAAERQRAMPTNRVFDVGDVVEVLEGPLEGVVVTVLEISRGFAEVVGVDVGALRLRVQVGRLGAVA